MKKLNRTILLLMALTLLCTAVIVPAYAVYPYYSVVEYDEVDPCENGHSMIPTDSYSTRWYITESCHTKWHLRRYNCQFCGRGDNVIVKIAVAPTAHDFGRLEESNSVANRCCSICGYKRPPDQETFQAIFLP